VSHVNTRALLPGGDVKHIKKLIAAFTESAWVGSACSRCCCSVLAHIACTKWCLQRRLQVR
jgi:hypothetical protein